MGFGTMLGMATGGLPLLSTALAAGDSIASAYGSYQDYKAQESANATNMQIAQNQQDFQENMSNTAYQRATADMKKAGINPMLAYERGGASTPSGATTTVQPASKGGMFKNTHLQASALEGVRLANETNKMQSEADLNRQKDKTEVTQQNLNDELKKQATNSAAKAKTEQELLELTKPAVGTKSDKDAKKNQIDKDLLYLDAVIDRLKGFMPNINIGGGRRLPPIPSSGR